MREIATTLLVLIAVSGAVGFVSGFLAGADDRSTSFHRMIDPALLEPYRRYAIMEPTP